MIHRDGDEDWLRRNWAQMPERFGVTVEGAMLACHGWNLAAEDLPGVVLVHGFRAHAHWWDHVAPSLTARHRVVAFSFSGMGDSERRPAYSRAQAGREILGVAAALGFAPAIVIAHSFGSIAALLAARSAPDRFRRLVVIDAGIPSHGENQIPVMPARRYPDAASAIARFRLSPPGAWPVRAVHDYIARHSVVETAAGYTWKFDPDAAASLNAERYRDAMFGVTVPIDLIRGEHSEIMTPDRVATLRAMADDVGPEIVIPASHHHVMIEQPVALAAALQAILAADAR